MKLAVTSFANVQQFVLFLVFLHRAVRTVPAFVVVRQQTSAEKVRRYGAAPPPRSRRRRVASSSSSSSSPSNDEEGGDDPFGDFDDGVNDNFVYEHEFDDDNHQSVGVPASQTHRGQPQQSSSHFFSRKSLSDPSFALADGERSSSFRSLCDDAGITRPSKIQSLVWPVLLQGRTAIVAEQTGSGKTLAYLLPLVHRAIAVSRDSEEEEGQSVARNNNKRYGSPRILILAPTAELADQIRTVAGKILRHRKDDLKALVVTASGRYSTNIRDQIRKLQRQPVDVLISTPGRLSTILRTRNNGLDLSHLQSIVLDEVDVLMMDDTFGPQLREVGAAAPVQQTQFVFVTATLPEQVVQNVEREFPGVVQIRGPGLHRVAPTVDERLVDVSVPTRHHNDAKFCFDVKAEQLLKSLRQTRCRRTLVFCNTVESCRKVENLLKRGGNRRNQLYDVRAYHNAMTPEARNDNLSAFTASSGGRGSEKRHETASQRSSDDLDRILVCTDRAARGVDFDAAPVDHVVIFDFPKDPAEYVRRVGRTARAGRGGTSTVFVYGWQLPIARSVMGHNSKFDGVTGFVPGDEEDDDDSYGGGAKRRRNRLQRGKSPDSMKQNIERGKLWGS